MASTVSFPTSEPSPSKSVHQRPPYQPFRRISLPTRPSINQRPVSVGSLQEEDGPSVSSSIESSTLSPLAAAGRPQTSRPGSVEFPSSAMAGGPRGVHKRASKSVVSFKSTPAVNEQKLAKRNKIIDEFYETEKAYVSGLDLIYEHFLTPMVDSLNTSSPILSRADLTNIFSNFIDIWNLHRNFLTSLTELLHPSSPPSPPPKHHPHLSPPLSSHFPYLSLYTPFITAFPATLQTLQLLLTPSSPTYSHSFASFVTKQEKDPRCGKLKLRDWLLTIVQRCPRYLLLLKDLESVEADEEEKAKLVKVKGLVEKITSSLNTSLSAHLTMLSLLSLQRNTANLPFQLISPGRSLIRRSPLFQVERSEAPRERDFLLFSDCLVWIASEESEKEWHVGKHWWQSHIHHHHHKDDRGKDHDKKKRHSALVLGKGDKGKDDKHERLQRPGMPPRTRSKSEAEVTEMKAKEATAIVAQGGSKDSAVTSAASGASSSSVAQVTSPPTSSSKSSLPFSASTPTSPNMSRPGARPKRHSFLASSSSSAIPRSPKKRPPPSRQSSMGGFGGAVDERWVFKGRVMLVDVNVVVMTRPVSYHSSRSSSFSEEVQQPEINLDQEEEDDGADDESDEARRFELLSSHGSFVLYAANGKERDEWVEAIRGAKEAYMSAAAARGGAGTTRSHGSGLNTSTIRSGGGAKGMMALPYKVGDERIGTLSRTAGGGVDELRVEKRTKVDHFVPPIWIPDSKTGECMRCGRGFGWRRRRHHCRLCGRCVCASCSECTFYITSTTSPGKEKPARACNACYETVFPVIQPSPENSDAEGDDVPHPLPLPGQNSLTNFPSWLSMPSLPLSGVAGGPGVAEALMAIDSMPAYLVASPDLDDDDDLDFEDEVPAPALHGLGINGVPRAELEDGRKVVKRPSVSRSRPRSFVQIVEDFERKERRLSEDVILDFDDEDDDGQLGGGLSSMNSSAPNSPPLASSSQPHLPSRSRRSSRVSFAQPSSSQYYPRQKRKEDTIRKKKRFSLPAVALHTTSVTASSTPSHHQHHGHHPPSAFHHHHHQAPSGYKREKRFSLVLGTSGPSHLVTSGPGAATTGEGEIKGELANGVAAGKLNELLARGKVTQS